MVAVYICYSLQLLSCEKLDTHIPKAVKNAVNSESCGDVWLWSIHFVGLHCMGVVLAGPRVYF